MTGFKTTTSMDLFNSATGFTGAVLNESDRLLREKSDADLRLMASQYQLAAEEHLLGLERRNDYTNWASDTEKFLDDQKALMQKQSKNGYTNRMIDQMFAGYKSSLMANVEQRAWKSQIDDVTSESMQTIQNIKNMSISPQEKFNQINNEYTILYRGGYINHSTYKSRLMAEADEVVTNYLLSLGNAAIDEAIKNDDKASLERIIREGGIDFDFDVSYLHESFASNEEMYQKMASEKKNYETKIAANEKAKKDAQSNFDTEWGKLKKEEERAKRKSKKGTDQAAVLQQIDDRKWQLKDTYDGSIAQLTKERDNIGTSFDDYWENLRDKAEETESVKLSMMVNQKAIQDKVINTLNKSYDARLADMQTKNENKIEQHYTKLSSDILKYATGQGGSLESILTDINFGAMNVDKNYGGNKLASNKQSQWADKYRSLLNWVESAIKEGKNGSGPNKLPSYKELYDNEPDIMFDLVLQGYDTPLNAAKSLTNGVQNEIAKHPDLYKETAGKNPQEVQEEIQKNIGDIGAYKFLTSDKLIGTKGVLNTRYPGVMNYYNSFVDDVKKGKIQIDADGMEYVYESLLKMSANTDIHVEPKDLQDDLIKSINIVKMGIVNDLFAEKGLLESEESYIGRLAFQSQDNDLVTQKLRPVTTFDPTKTPEENAEINANINRMYAPGAKEKLEEVKNTFEPIIKNAIGNPNANIVARHEQAASVKGSDIKNDENSNWIFKDMTTGQEYKIVPVMNKGETKAVSYNVINAKTGELVKEGALIASGNKEARIKQQAKMDEADEVTSERKSLELSRESEEAKQYASASKLPTAVERMKVSDKKNWLNPTGRKEIVNDTITKVDSLASYVVEKPTNKQKKNGYITKSEFKNKTGLDYDEWMSKQNIDEQIKYILQN